MSLSLSDRPTAEAALYAFFAAVDACDWDALAGVPAEAMERVGTDAAR